MKLKSMAALGAAAVLALSACQPTLVPKVGTPPSADKANTGNLRISVPSVSPLVARALGLSGDSTSPARTLLVVTSVDLELWLEGTMVDSTSVAVDLSLSSGGESEPIEWTVPAANGYTAVAKIYNGNVSTTTPVLYGESEPFDVVSGGSQDVAILPIPDATHTFPPGTIPLWSATTQTSLGACTPTADPTVYNWNQEKWFTIDATSNEAILITATGDASSGTVIVCADENGRSMAMALSGGVVEGGPEYWTLGGSARLGVFGGGMRYIGLMSFAETPITSNVTLSYENYQDDANEPNNTLDDATLLASNVEVDGTNLDPKQWTESGPPEGGDWYSFVVNSGVDSNDVGITLTYDADWAPLELQLYDSSGNLLESAPVPVLSGPVNPSAEETAQISRNVLDGTYYVLVSSGGMPFLGSTYKLKYVAGTGTARFLIQ